MVTLQLNTKQMANEFSRLFFLINQLRSTGATQELQENLTKQDYLLKELVQSGYDVDTLINSLKMKKLFNCSYDSLFVFTDGGVRNNHLQRQNKVGASSFCLYGDKKLLVGEAEYFGKSCPLPTGRTAPADSLLAEYYGLLKAFRFIQKHKVQANRIVFLSDSSSLVDSITSGRLPRLNPFRGYAIYLRTELAKYANASIVHVPRAQNAAADRLVRQKLEKEGDVVNAKNKR